MQINGYDDAFPACTLVQAGISFEKCHICGVLPLFIPGEFFYNTFRNNL
jgi:hypothetical protein